MTACSIVNRLVEQSGLNYVMNMTMDTIGAFEAKTHLPQLLERVARGESLTITKHGKPVARLVPVDSSRKQAREAAARIIERRQNIERVPLQELLATVHEGHRY